MDSLTTAMKNNIVPNQEYLLQGSVLDSAVEVLLHRLRGLCDNVDSGPETFHDHEMCFSISNCISLYLINLFRMCTTHGYSIFIGSGTPQPLTLRVRRAIDYLEMPYQLRYIGQPELGKINLNCTLVNWHSFFILLGDKSRPTILRSSIDVATTPTIVDFLTEMGFRMDFEYILRGYMFRKGRMKITVSKIFKVSDFKYIFIL